ncbi:ligand-binding sensor domain-containing protein [Pseudoxanthomonas composti]|uniref:Diguanylate cyclase n=1 Tax=Pseudoxanthomonas composti TaxID=2137479 RepID=A0A4Q1JWP3_9GAMM|nr:diguanylate cyclase [Pseudoxanthomonas composti]RXR06467.1 diguanylate cyclase [Pseudoxanthomonas composti]
MSSSRLPLRMIAGPFRAGRVIARLRGGLLALLMLACPAMAGAPDRWAALSEPVFRSLETSDTRTIAGGITDIVQDGPGFLWLGSNDGLSRWDGYQLRVYRYAPGAPNSLPQSEIQALGVDGDGELWIGAVAGTLARYDRQRDRFVTYPLDLGDGRPSQASVNRLLDDGGHGLWLATDAGLVHLDRRTGQARLEQATQTRVTALLLTRDGTLWLATRDRLLRRAPGTRAFAVVALPLGHHQRAPVTQLMEDSAGRIWVATNGSGAFVSDRDQRRFRAVRGPRERAPDMVLSLLEVQPGRVWLGTDTDGILQISHTAPQLRYLSHDPLLATSIGEGPVTAMLRDRSGQAWVGTDRSLRRLDAGQRAFQTIFGNRQRPEGIGAADVPALELDRNGRVWAGTSDAGVAIIDPATGQMRHLRPDPRLGERALPNKYVTAFALAADGGMFIGTTLGLYRTDPSGTSVRRVQVPGRPDIARVNRLLVDAEGDLWVGGNDGLRMLPSPDCRGPHQQPFNRELTDQRISMLAQRDADSLWVGTLNGLSILDIRSGHLRQVAGERGSMGMVTSMLQDAQGRLWVGSLGHGLHVLRQQGDERWVAERVFDTGSGLRDSNVNAIVRADDGQLWISTDDGLASIDPRDMRVRNYGATDGVLIGTYWTRAVVRPERDTLLFGGLGGITVVHPSELSPWRYVPQVVVTEARIGGKPVWIPPQGSTVPFKVPADANSIAISFAALDLSAPAHNRYAYRLRGLDQAWTQGDADNRQANYSNLPPGQYTLEVRGSNRTGAWSPSQLALVLEVEPKWYQALWARVLMTLATGLAVIGIMQLRTLRLRQQTARLERLVELRTRELRESRERMQHLAYVDSLTGLPNRRDFNERMAALTARLDGEGFALLLIDLDHFKSINDSLGHDAGDATLIETGLRLAQVVRSDDGLFRLGGDEFALVITQAPDRAMLEALCARVVKRFSSPVLHGQDHIRASISIGIALFPRDGQTADALYKAADRALYDAKDAGRDTWAWARTP